MDQSSCESRYQNSEDPTDPRIRSELARCVGRFSGRDGRLEANRPRSDHAGYKSNLLDEPKGRFIIAIFMDNYPYIATFTVLLATAFLVNKWLDYANPNLSSIPAIGPTGRLSSFIGACRFVSHGHEMIQEGIQKYQSAVFRVPTVDRWMVILPKKSLINDVRQAREDELSFNYAANETIQSRYTLGKDVMRSNYHADVVKLPLTRNLADRFSDVKDEIAAAFNDNIPKTEDWVSVPALDAVRQIVVRTSNRFFVGLPLCRDPDYVDLNSKFTIQVIVIAIFLNNIPLIFRLIIGPLLSPMSKAIKRTKKHLEPLIIQRMKDDAELGADRKDRPNDLITWLLDADAPKSERNATAYAKRILMVNFAAVHSSANTFTQALLQLAGRPEYIGPLRIEVESVIGQEGWSKAAMGKLHKLDSFIRECIRWEGLSSLAMIRVVRKPEGFTFSDGTHLPQGTFVACPAWDIHHSEDNHVKASEFNGFRFFDMRQLDGESTHHRFTSASAEYVPFGHGRHVCPGRFFAANELKAMFAHILLNYDVKLEKEIPPTKWFNEFILVDKDTRVMFRKRRL